MTIPDLQTLMRPILTFLADGQADGTPEVIAAMSDVFLTVGGRLEMIPSGRARLVNNRVGWALTHLS